MSTRSSLAAACHTPRRPRGIIFGPVRPQMAREAVAYRVPCVHGIAAIAAEAAFLLHL